MISSLGAALFGVLSFVSVAASVHAWRTRLLYGLWRFLGFESLALLIAWNAEGWFHDPFAVRQLASWTIFAASTALAIHGVHLLRSIGGASRRVTEDTHRVVEIGVYRYIRHPLYASLAFFGWGVFLKGVDLPSAALACAATVFWLKTARCEERFNVRRFGDAYSEYMKHTRMFVPFLI